MRGRRPDSFIDRARRARTALLAASAVLLLIFLFYVLPRGEGPVGANPAGRKALPGGGAGTRYAVIFDAGSSGSRVHVYCFDRALELVPIGDGIELFEQIKPGLSSYAQNPRAAAESLSGLLEKAEKVIPSELRRQTPVRVGATAGLRTLGAETSDKILEEVRNFLDSKSSLMSKPEWVSVLDGTQEGAYQWVTINYLAGNVGKKYSDTVGVVDLGGGSVQMAYAISEKEAASALSVSKGADSYVKELFLKGVKYYLYVHSYLHYGLLAARAEILKDNDAGSSCILAGNQGSYTYGDKNYPASASPEGPNYSKCRGAAIKALNHDAACTHLKCTFGGVWNGGGGDGQTKLFVASFFFDRASEAGFISSDLPVVKVKPSNFEEAAKNACAMSVSDAKAKYSHVQEDNLPYLCMDLTYQYTLLVDGFDLDPEQDITLVKKVKYRDSYVEAAWPLGSAIEVASSA